MEWMAIGPLGHEKLPDYGEPPQNSAGRNAWRRNVMELITSAWAAGNYYPMDRRIALEETFKGAMTKDVQGWDQSLKWELAYKKLLPNNEYETYTRHPRGQTNAVSVSYFSAWFYVPADTDAIVQFDWNKADESMRSQMAANAWVHGEMLKNVASNPEFKDAVLPADNQKVRLKKGWNHLYERVLNVSGRINPGASMTLILPKDKATGARPPQPNPPPEIGTSFRINGTP